MSIPLDTPAAVMIRCGRCSTTRCGTYRAPSPLSSSAARQCVVAVNPSSKPAAASSSAPVHTEVVNLVCGCTACSQPRMVSSSSSPRVPMPPGNTTTSGASTSSKVASQVTPSMPFSVRTSPRWCPMNTTSIDGIRCRTS
ncbi:ThiJ/PfpI family protein [Mycobacterium marinum MB2]|nr:ThiJ/PfpI family protein [Mycobacterium marinum MB2]